MGDGYEIRRIHTIDEFKACVALQKEVWGTDFSEVVPAAILWAAQEVGGITAGAFDAEGHLAGLVFGLTGVQDGRLVHWSDLLAVRPGLRDRGLGVRLKRFQRDELLRLGVGVVCWTFDPLEAKNAYINFARLGVVAQEYHPDLYGRTDSPLHHGIGTDRLIAMWEIDGARVRRRLDGDEPPPTADDVAGVPIVNEPRSGPHGLECLEPDLGLDAECVRITIPADIQALKARSPERAAEWRARTRAAFLAYFGRGYRAVDVVRQGEWSSYVLERGERSPLDS